MSWLSRLRNLLRADRLSDDIDRELKFHLAERTDDLVASGMRPEVASREARRRFGNFGLQKERTRDRDMVAWLDSLANDVRYAARALRSTPVFALVAILSLALGIGANTAIFTIINAVMLKSLPVAHPEELVAIVQHDGSEEFTNPLWEQIRDRQDVFGGAFAYGTQPLDLSTGGEARRADGMLVSGGFFSTLGVRPAAGRLLSLNDDIRGCAANAVLSSGFAESEFGSADAAIGKSLPLNGHPYTVVGVTDRRFGGISVGQPDQVYIALCSLPIIDGTDARITNRSTWYLRIIGRPKPAVSVQRIGVRLATLAPVIAAATLPPNWSADQAAGYLEMKFDVTPAAKGFSDLRTTYRKALLVVMAIVALVLLIACANVANLLLARATVRQREIAVRLALGASRGRLFRQLLTESVLLSTLGAAAGILFAMSGSRLLVGLLARRNQAVALDLSLDLRILTFTIGVAVITGVSFGLAPAWRAGQVNPQSAMKAQGRGVSAGHSRFTAGKALVVAQVALSLVLIAAAGLLLGSWRKLATLDPGFRRDRVLLVDADLAPAPIPAEQRQATYAQIVGRLRAIPGVRDVGMSQITPIGASAWNNSIKVDGFTPQSKRDAISWMNAVGAAYFAALHVPILSGRDFGDTDTPESPKVAIVSREMARKFFGTTTVVGRHFQTNEGRSYSDPIEIVGVVADTKYRSLRDSIQPIVYLAAAQEKPASPSYSFELRTATDPAAITRSVTEAVAAVNPRISLDVTTLERQVDESMAVMKTIASLSGFFGALALALAMIGLYGIMAYNVARRRNEIGVRIALGAAQSRMVRMVLGAAGRMVVAGVVLGLGLALFATRLVSTFLYDTAPTDVPTLAAAGIILIVVGIVAAALPAWRASRLDPVAALREE